MTKVMNKEITNKHQAYDLLHDLQRQLEDTRALLSDAEDRIMEYEGDINYLNIETNKILDIFPDLREHMKDGEKVSEYLPTALFYAGYNLFLIEDKTGNGIYILRDREYEVIHQWGYTPSLGELMELSEIGSS